MKSCASRNASEWGQRTGCLNDRQVSLLEKRLQGLKARMKAKKTVEIDCRLSAASLWLRNGDGGPHLVVIRLGERNNDVQTIHRAALKQHNHFLLGVAVAATARCKNNGSVAIPSMAIPPFFRK